MVLASKEAVHPQGEWNHVEIVSLNGKLDFYMNGVHTLSTHLWNENWRQMVAVSKFKDMRKFKENTYRIISFDLFWGNNWPALIGHFG